MVPGSDHPDSPSVSSTEGIVSRSTWASSSPSVQENTTHSITSQYRVSGCSQAASGALEAVELVRIDDALVGVDEGQLVENGIRGVWLSLKRFRMDTRRSRFARFVASPMLIIASTTLYPPPWDPVVNGCAIAIRWFRSTTVWSSVPNLSCLRSVV